MHIMFCMFSTIRVIIVYIERISTKNVLSMSISIDNS